MDEIRTYSREEVAKMANNDVTDLINELFIKYNFQNHKIIEKDHELERLKNLLKGSEGAIEQQRKVIDRYRTEIDNLKKEIKKLHQEEEIKAYSVQDICSMADTVAFHLKMSSVDDGMRYTDYAKHLMRKYEALTDHGFSHDDAMSLIPLWDDVDFENFKK